MSSQVVWNMDSIGMPVDFVKQFDVLITDPPYRKHVHANATSQSRGRGTRKRELGFQSLSRRARSAISCWTKAVKRWSIVYSDVEDSGWLRLAAQARDVEYIRTVPWVRWSMPQLSGDRPPQGFEHILVFHPKGKKHWNGPGNLTHFEHLSLRGEDKHKCEKPLDQALDVVSFFSDPGESVFDGFAGNATFGLACRLLGRSYVGFDDDPVWAARGSARLTDPLSERDMTRVKRWLEASSEPESQQTENALVRARSRAQDKITVRNYLGL